MKDVFELGSTSPSDVLAITPKVISATLEEIARGRNVFAQFYKPNTDLMTSGGNAVEFPIEGSGIVVQTNMSAGDTLNTGNMSYTAKTIAIQKHGVGIGFYNESLRQVRRDVIKDAIVNAGKRWADAMDTLALEAMFPTVTIVGSGAETVTATGTIIIGVKSITGNVSSIVIGNDTKVVFGGAGTLVAWYIPTTAGARTLTTTAGSLSAKDILNAKTSIISHNYDPDVLILNQYRFADIVYDPTAKLIEKHLYNDNAPLLNGEIGTLWGMKVIITTKCPIYGAILLAKDKLGYNVKRMKLELNKDEYSGMKTDMLYFFGFAEESFGVVNPRSYGAVAVAGTFVPMVNPTI